MKKCAIQIITEDPFKGGRNGVRWIALAKDINPKIGRYENIVPYHPKGVFDHNGTKLNKGFFFRLFHGHNYDSDIATFDIIRNPTMEELIEISNAAKHLGIKINLKTGEYIGKLK
jgi:hypothetical protein